MKTDGAEESESTKILRFIDEVKSMEANIRCIILFSSRRSRKVNYFLCKKFLPPGDTSHHAVILLFLTSSTILFILSPTYCRVPNNLNPGFPIFSILHGMNLQKFIHDFAQYEYVLSYQTNGGLARAKQKTIRVRNRVCEFCQDRRQYSILVAMKSGIKNLCP